MCLTEPSHLRHIWHSRRVEIAQRWHEAIALTGCVPHSSTEVRQRLIDLVEQVIDLLCDPPLELEGWIARDEARAIGAALARLQYVQPEVGRTVEVLACQLTADLSPEQVVAWQPRIAALLGELAVGCSHQVQTMVLTAQEQIRQALTAQLQHTAEELKQHHVHLEKLVEKRTADLMQANTQLEQEIIHHQRTERELEQLRI